MAYGLKALFFKNAEDAEPRYTVEIKGIIQPYNLIDEYGFKEVHLNEGYVDFMLDVSDDDLHRIIIGHYGPELEDLMIDLNQELVHTLFEGDKCTRKSLWIYEYDAH